MVLHELKHLSYVPTQSAVRPQPQPLVALMFLSFIHSLSQQVFLGLLLGVLCNELYKMEVHIRHISVFQAPVGGDTRPTYKELIVSIKSSRIMVQ